ncbi:NADPH-dependent FMN reductase [Tabrizicola sp. M-4]|uniref:NADPH-dependent FMN reductase n=1 Tax=Tabrizicola sp. M-4 TaxID=3055847 RepID=UPI003DAA081F
MKRILIMVGSLRAAASSAALARALVERLPPGVQAEFADIGSLPHYDADHDGGAPVAALLDQLRAADGVLFVTPEYNYSIPGALKNAIDWASRPAYQSVFKGKSCFVISVSGGALGGVRAQGHLKYILNGMLAEVFPHQEVIVPEAPKKVTDGRFTDEGILAFAEGALSRWLTARPVAP